MILICGTKLKMSELPNNGLEYYIETDESQYLLTLGTFLLTDDFYEYAFVSSSYKSLVPDNPAISVEYFKNDEELLSLLDMSKGASSSVSETDTEDTASDFMMIAELQTEVDELTLTVGKLQREKSDLEDTIAEKDALVEQLQTDLKEKEDIIKEQNETLDNDEEQKAKTDEQIESYNQEIAELKETLESVQNVVKIKESVIASYENGDNPKLQELQDEYDKLQDRLESYEKGDNPALSEAQEKCAELQEELESSKKAEAEIKGKCEELQGKLEQSKGVEQELRDKCATLEKSLESSNAADTEQLQEIKSKCEELEKELARVKTEDEAKVKELQEKCDSLEQGIAEKGDISSEELAALQGKYAELEKQLEDSKTSKEEAVKVLQEMYDRLQTEYEEYKEKGNAELQEQLDTLTAEKEKLETTKSPAHIAVEAELEQLKADFETFKNTENPELVQLRSDYAKLESEFTAYKSTDTPEMIELRNKCNLLEGEKTTLETSADILKGQIEELMQEKLETQQLISTLQAQIAEKNKEVLKQRSDFELEKAGMGVELAKVSSLNGTIQTLNDDIVAKQKSIKDLTLLVAQKDKELLEKGIEIQRVTSELSRVQGDLDFAEDMKRTALEKQKLEFEAETVGLRNELSSSKQRLEELKKAYSNEVVGESPLSTGFSSGKATKDYDMYVMKPKTALNVGFSNIEKGYLNFTNEVVILTSCGDGGVTIMRETVKHWVDTGYSMCVLDFTGDMYLTFNYKLQAETSGTTTGDLLKSNATVSRTAFKSIKNSLFVPCVPFNDVALLEQNWGKLLNEVSMAVQENMPIIILLNGFESFITRYVIQKLSAKYNTMLFMEGQPSFMYGVNAFLRMVDTKAIGVIAGNVTNAVAPKLQSMFGAYKLSKFYPKGVVPDVNTLATYYSKGR